MSESVTAFPDDEIGAGAAQLNTCITGCILKSVARRFY